MKSFVRLFRNLGNYFTVGDLICTHPKVCKITHLKSDISSIKTLSRTMQVCSGVVVGLGMIALLGWVFYLPMLASIGTDTIPMSPNTAVMFVVLGITLFVLARWPMHHIPQVFARVAAIFDLLLGLLALVQYFTDIGLGIDQLPFNPLGTPGLVIADFVSPITAVNFLMAGLSIILVLSPSSEERGVKSLSSVLATLVMSIGSVVMLGYLYGTPLLYGGKTMPVAFTTAVAFVFLGIGLIIASGPKYWPLRLVADSSTRARLMRVFFPIIVSVVLLKGWLDTVIFTQSKSNPALISVLLAILFVVIAGGIIMQIARRIGNSIDHAETKRMLAEEQLRKLSIAVEQSPSTVMITDTKGNIEYINKKFTQLTGYIPEEVIGKNPRFLKSGKTPPETYERLWHTIISGKEWRGEFYNKKKNGEFYWEYASISPIRNSEGTITHFLAVKEDITERKNFESQLAYMADRDPLTNLFNRRRFQEELENWLAQTKRYNIYGSLLFIDLDNFKYINDTLGHQTGDILLKTVASLLQKRVRHTDVLARVGGDEFAVILQRTNLEQAQSIAREILDLVRYHARLEEEEFLGITASIGIVLFPDHGNTIETLLSYADLAMYKAKEEGRNRVCVYTPDQKTQIESRLIWKKRITDALEYHRFVLLLQSILDLRNNRIVGYETLLRMIDENGKLIPPSEFLDIAERFGLIGEIDRWVVCRAIHILAELRMNGKAQHLEVNLSSKALSDSKLMSIVQQELIATGIDPVNLILEISESAVVENINEAQHFMTSFKTLGCRFALDDFGIVFSSLNYIKHLPVDYLKINGGFIRNLPNDLADQHLVKAMVEVAHGLGKQTIAKFVNSNETLQLLQEYGVDYAQGHYIGQPSTISEIKGNPMCIS